MESAAAIAMAEVRGEDLKYRQAMMRRKRSKLKKLLGVGAAVLVSVAYIGSYCFILEPISVLSSSIGGTISDDSFYAVLREDGTYDIYLDDFYNAGILQEGCFIENVDSLEYYIGISIRRE